MSDFDRSCTTIGRSYTSDKSDVEALLNIEAGLTAWEARFAESMAAQVIDRLKTMSPRQRAKVDQILERMGLA